MTRLDQASQLRAMIAKQKQETMASKVDTSEPSKQTPLTPRFKTNPFKRTAKESGIRVLAVGSGKGGTGKTNTVLNLALEFEQMGKHPLIIDADTGLTTLKAMYGGHTQYVLQDVLTQTCSLEQALVEGPEGVKFLFGGCELLKLNEMDETHQVSFQKQWATLETVDLILIDLGAGVDKNTLMYAMLAQELILMTTSEPTALSDAYSLLKVIDLLRVNSEVQVIVNRTSGPDEAVRTFNGLHAATQRYLKLSLCYVSHIREDASVIESLKIQVPLTQYAPNSVAAQDVRVIARRLSGQTTTSTYSNMTAVANRLSKILRLFK